MADDIERVARAIWETRFPPTGHYATDWQWDDADEQSRTGTLKEARAAIASMEGDVRNAVLEEAAALADEFATKSRATAKRLARHPAQGIAEQDYDRMADDCTVAAEEAECLAKAIRALKSPPPTHSGDGE